MYSVEAVSTGGLSPGLEPDQLFGGRGLPYKTNFRDVLGEILMQHIGKAIFPEFFLIWGDASQCPQIL